MNRRLGVGVVGLHEGRTLLVALTHNVPSHVSQSQFIHDQGQSSSAKTRARYARAVGGCDLRQAKIDAARQACPNLFYTTSYEELLARDDVDIVAVYTPDDVHGENIVQAFEAGKHVICTKPLVNSLDDARRVLDASRRTDRKLLVGQSIRFFESFIRQRQAYESDEVGTLEFVDAHYIHRMDWFYDKSPWAATSTDWVFLGLSHPIDLIRWYLGPIGQVHAFAHRSALGERYGVRSHDIYTVNVRAVDGRIGRAMGHYGLHELPSARNAIELVLYGSDGTSMAQYHDMRYYHTAPDGAEIEEDMLYSRRGYYFNNEVHGMHYGEFANYTEYFAAAILEGRNYSPDLKEGIESLCVMEAIRQSVQGGEPVKVAPILECVGLEASNR